ncbi:MAG: flavodoxin domain-containing protein [Legionellales bacterium]
MKILIVYGTTEGQTRKIAEFLRAETVKSGHTVSLADSTEGPPSPLEYDAVLVGGSMHMQKYQASIKDYVQKHKRSLNQMHSAFFSVSLSAASDEEESWKELKEITEDFLEKTGWKPSMVEYVAGALLYTEYDFMKKFIMRLIAKRADHNTDTNHDTEYTDWNKLKTFLHQFIDSWVPVAQAVQKVESDTEAIG